MSKAARGQRAGHQQHVCAGLSSLGRSCPPGHELLRRGGSGSAVLLPPALLHALRQRRQQHVGQRVAPQHKAPKPVRCMEPRVSGVGQPCVELCTADKRRIPRTPAEVTWHQDAQHAQRQLQAGGPCSRRRQRAWRQAGSSQVTSRRPLLVLDSLPAATHPHHTHAPAACSRMLALTTPIRRCTSAARASSMPSWPLSTDSSSPGQRHTHMARAYSGQSLVNP